jgi:hypothetical protein
MELMNPLRKINVRGMLPAFSADEGDKLIQYFQEKRLPNTSAASFYQKVTRILKLKKISY